MDAEIDSGSSLLDLLEEYIQVSGWEYARVTPQVINFKRVGEWSEYSFYVAEQNSGAVLVVGYFELKIPKKQKKKCERRLYQLMNLFHMDVPLGTFSLDKSMTTGIPVVSWAHQFFSGEDTEPESGTLERVLNEAMAELEEMYPSFQRVVLPGVTVQQAYDSAIPEVYGRA